jgi:hypothetical protein
MDDFAHAIGTGISGLVGNALSTIGAVLNGLVERVDSLLPGGSGVVIVVGGALLLLLAWNLLRR